MLLAKSWKLQIFLNLIYRPFQLLNLVRIYAHGFYEFSRMLMRKNLKSWWSWAMCNFQLYASNIEDNISHQKLRNCCVAKKLMSDTFSVKFRVFRREFLRNHSVYWAQIFRDNWNYYALSIFLVFILLASWDSDKPKLMRQKVYIISIFFLLGKCLLFCKSAWTQLSLDRWGKRRVRVSDIRLRRDWHAVGRSVYHGQRNFISHGW